MIARAWTRRYARRATTTPRSTSRSMLAPSRSTWCSRSTRAPLPAARRRDRSHPARGRPAAAQPGGAGHRAGHAGGGADHPGCRSPARRAGQSPRLRARRGGRAARGGRPRRRCHGSHADAERRPAGALRRDRGDRPRPGAARFRRTAPALAAGRADHRRAPRGRAACLARDQSVLHHPHAPGETRMPRAECP